MAQAVLADSFPPEKRGLAFSLYGVTAVCAPAIGPTLGGWITDSFSWRWIFFINIPVGILTLVLVYMLLEDPPYLKELKRGLASFDAIGFSLLVLGVGALQILLDKGQEDDWFGSRFITTLVVVSAVSFVSLVIWEWHHKEPIVDVRLFKNFSFAIGNVMFLMLGISLMASTVLIPQFLQTLMGYTAQQAGMVLTSGALVTLVTIPIIGKLTTLIQARYLIAFGWITMAASLFISCRENSLTMSFNGASWLRILQSIPMGFSLSLLLSLDMWVSQREEQCCFRHHELHAQYRPKHRHFNCHHADCAAHAVSSNRSFATHLFRAFPGCDRRSRVATFQRRSRSSCRPPASSRQALFHASISSHRSFLRRCLLDTRHRIGDHGLPFLHDAEE
jgi:MFS family permease